MLSIEGAGVQSVDTPLAPPDGYQDRGEGLRQAPSEFGSWPMSRLYYRRGDHFGRLVIELFGPDATGKRQVRVKGYLNESGGRNTDAAPSLER